ncbi:carrier protein YMC2, partial [Aureobasidium melanogenum]
MSAATSTDPASLPRSHHDGQTELPKKAQPAGNYKGFVAGVFSGIAKLTVGHPFDTIKVRLQTSQKSQFNGPLDCLMQTIRKEGPQGLYKGATPPLVGWMFMDSLMLGSLTFYRKLLNERVFQPMRETRSAAGVYAVPSDQTLPTIGHAIAGIMAGSTVSFIAAPVEHVKARLQIVHAKSSASMAYEDCIMDSERR